MRILVIRLSSIGDVILTTPILSSIKEKYPDAIIDFLVMDKFKDAIEGCTYVDNVILFEKENHDGIFKLYKLGKELKKNNYTYIFDLHSKFRSWIISFSIGGNIYRYNKRAFWKTLLVKMRLIKYKVDNTIIKNYFKPFKNLGVFYTGEKLNFTFEQSHLQKVAKYDGHPVFAPGASKETKKWPVENFGILSKKLFEKYGKEVIIIGGKEDASLAEKIHEIDGGTSINLCGKISLKESGALLSKSKFIVTNDSGPFHISRGVKCKSFVIFGPTSPEMFEFNEGEMLVYSNENCAPCSLHGDKKCPKGHFNCMRNVTPEDVYNIITENE